VSVSQEAVTTSTDRLILVDEQDNEIGSCEKLDCHVGQGKLHRAFSVFLFNPEGKVLLQQRSQNKMLWGGYWANSCCSHPRLGEATDAAARRRIKEELGVDCDLQYLYKFIYRAEFAEVGTEYENCWVYAGRFKGELNIDEQEVSATRLVTPDELTAEIDTNGKNYSPWLKLEWERIRKEFLTDLT